MNNRIAQVRAQKGLTQAELAARLHVSLSTIGKIERGDRGLTLPMLTRIAKELAVPAEGLVFGADGLQSKAPDLAPVISTSDDEEAVYIREVDLSYSMGAGTVIEDYPEEGHVRFDPGLLRSITRSPADRLFVARGTGDSMFPTLINNDLVVIDTAQRTLNQQDRIWAISLYGAGALKRLRAIGKTRVLVISDNPDIGNQEVDADDLYIAGRVVWVARRI